jgi:2-hydroxy-3-oxopropionate reductase
VTPLVHETTVGFVGLGIMGLPMARNLLHAGYTLQAHNRSRSPVEELADQGARPVGSPAEAASGADVVICMLPDSPDVEEVVLGERGIAESIERDATLIDMSTISPITTRRIAESLARCDVRTLDAPVSGGEQGAIDGVLAIMVGGEQEVFDRWRPLLDVMGRSVKRIGEVGAGQVAKACNQIIVAGTIQAVSEAFTLAGRLGVDPVQVRDALLGGFAGSKIMEVHGQRIIDRAFQPGFKASLHHKDLGIALEVGAAAGVPLQTTALLRELLGVLIAHGAGDADHSALALVAERLSGQAPPELDAFRHQATRPPNTPR